jgi:hypothetical protein
MFISLLRPRISMFHTNVRVEAVSRDAKRREHEIRCTAKMTIINDAT